MLTLMLLASCDRAPAPVTTTPAEAYAAAVACPASPARDGVSGFARWPYLTNVTQDAATLHFGTWDAVPATVRYGADGTYGYSATGHSTPLPMDDVTGERLHLHTVRLEGLTPGTRTCYAVEAGDVTAGGFHFWTAPADAAAPVAFLALGDYGSLSAGQLAVHAAMAPYLDQAHFLLTLGDNAYGDGTFGEWDRNVFQVYRDQWTDLPVFPVPGNHDYKTDYAGPMLANFELPRQTLALQESERYYDLRWGALHLLALDSEGGLAWSGTDRTDDQIDWLEDRLAGAAPAPWRVAAWHKPPYSGSPDREGDLLSRLLFVPVLQEHGTQLVLNGHNHFYERFDFMRDDVATPMSAGGIAYITSGGGGGSISPVGPADNQVTAVSAWHFLFVEVTECTFRVRAIDKDSAVIDDVTWERCG